MRSNTKTVNLIIASQIIGVGSSIILALVAQGNDAYYLSFYRFLIGFIIFLPLVATLKSLSKTTWVASFLYALDIIFFIVALSLENIAVVAAIVASGPILALIFEKIRKHATLSKSGVAVVTLVAIGVSCTVLPPLAMVVYAGEVGNSLGVLFAILASLTGAASIVFFKEKSEESPWGKTLAINIAGVALTTPILILLPFQFNTELLIGAFTAAAGGGGLAVVLILIALKQLPGSIIMALSAVGIPLTAVGGVIFLNQNLNLNVVVGILFITSATVVSSLRPMTVTK